MKKALIFAFACMCVFLLARKASAKQEPIENIATVAGSYSYDGFVPSSVVLFNGDLIVADKDNHRLCVVDVSTSKTVKTIGGYGKDNEKFRFPRDLAVYNRELFVADSFNNRIVILSDELSVLNVIPLKASPKEIAIYDGKLYILYEDGLNMDIYDCNGKNKISDFVLQRQINDFTVWKDTLILLGNESYAVSLKNGEYRPLDELNGCVSANGEGEGNLYALFDNSYRVLDSNFHQLKSYDINEGANCIYPDKDGAIIGNRYLGKVYKYVDERETSSYGKGQTTSNVNKVAVRGRMAAVANDDSVDLYKNGKKVASVDNLNPVDISLVDSLLVVLQTNSIKSYKVTQNGNDVSVEDIRTLNANSSYVFTGMDINNKNIYIAEKNSGKLLKTTLDLKVFAGAMSGLESPKSVTYGANRFYVAQNGKIVSYDVSGEKLDEKIGDYDAISHGGNNLFAMKKGGKEIHRFNNELEELTPIKYEGYFLSLSDVMATNYGVYVCDDARREVMVYTSEVLEIDNSNLTVGGKPFLGSVISGKTVTVNVSGAGMINPLPSIGDVRYSPSVLSIDTKVPFKEDKGRFFADVSLPNVGNYTLKVEYKKQKFIGGKWEDISTGNSNITYDLPITVTAHTKEIKERETIEVIKQFINKIFGW